MAFENITQLVQEAEQEQSQLDEANQALDTAKAELTQVMDQVAAKQSAVDTAREAAGKEKNDVITKIQAIVTACQEALTQLQE